MTSSTVRFTRAVGQGAVSGAAALIAGVVLAPAAGADDPGPGSPADAIVQTIGSASASASGSGDAGKDGSQPTRGPRVTVSQAVISANGEHEITVTGTGFSDDSVVATRPPLAGRSPGVYVVLGVFAEEWRPSEGAASSARKILSQYWAVDAADVETIGGAGRGAIVLDADGSFTATFTVSKARVEGEAGDATGTLGIYTYPGGGARHAAWEISQPISFAEPATGPLGSLAGLFPAS